MAILGVSSGIFPGSAIAAAEYALFSRYHVVAVEIGYEHASAALADEFLRDHLITLVRSFDPPARSLHAPYTDCDISVLDEERRQRAVIYLETVLELAVELKIDLVVVHASEEELAAHQRPARCAQARRSLASLTPKARALNLRLAVETMPPEWLPAGVSEAAELVRDLDPDTIGFCLDTNHANLTGDLPTIVRSLGSRLWNVHLSDNDGLRQQHWLPFQGIIDWQAFAESLIAVNYAAPLIYELDPHPAGPGRCLEEIEENFARLETLFPPA